MTWLLGLLKPIIQWLLSDLIVKAISAIKLYITDWANKRDREAAANKALDDFKEAGTAPELTPEQRAKEIEDAALKLSNDMRNLP